MTSQDSGNASSTAIRAFTLRCRKLCIWLIAVVRVGAFRRPPFPCQEISGYAFRKLDQALTHSAYGTHFTSVRPSRQFSVGVFQ